MHAGIHVIEKQQSIELYHHAGIHVIETGAKVVFPGTEEGRAETGVSLALSVCVRHALC